MAGVTIDWKTVNWPTTLFIVGYHLALVIGLPFYFWHSPPGLPLVLVSAGLVFVTGIGIGGAYHRYYSHRCYGLSRPAEAVLLLLATLATQGSALRWAFEHRLHHAYVDTDDDPYSIKKGFWYAHCLWLFEKARPIDERRVADLLQNRLVVLQDRYFVPLSMGGNFLLALGIGWLLGDFLGAFVLTWWTRLLVSHHLTWFINSLAHCWGSRSYSKEHSAVDNYVLAVLTVGEGYHNFHHTFPADYRNGVRWYHFDPTKWTVFLLSKIGLARNLRRYDEYKIKKRLLVEDRRLLLDRLRDGANKTRDELEQQVERLAATLHDKLNRLSSLTERLRHLEKKREDRGTVRDARRQLKCLHSSMRQDWKAWYQLCALVP